jgi:lipopolysaccharide transport system permease protein
MGTAMLAEEILIKPGRSRRNYFRDLWRFRELFYILAWRDLVVRYKQTVIGVAWALVRPVLMMLIFTVIFGKAAKLPSGGVPYPVLVLAGMLPWLFFATALTESSNSLITNSNLISKVYFPRLIVPASSVITSFVDFGITCGLLAVVMVIYGMVPSWELLALPLFVLLAFLAALGSGLWLAALNVEYRDFRYIVPFIVQFGMYVSPVGFTSEAVIQIFPEKWRWLYPLNPMVGVIDGFRWCLLGGSQPLDWMSVGLSAGLILLILFTGLYYFRRMERTFADVI